MAVTGISDLDGMFKKQFHDRIEDLIPDHAILQREGFISWVDSDKMNGQFYAIPTLLRSNQGVTYNGESGASASLLAARPGLMKEAQVYGSEMMLRGQLVLKVLSQAAEKGPKAFAKASAWLVEDLTNVAYTRVEIAALYGQTGLGTVESVTDIDGATATVVITEATFAPGMWVLLEGAGLDSFTGTTKNNATAALTVNSVTIGTRSLVVTYSGTLGSEIAANDVLFFEGANAGSGSFKEMCGLFKQLTTTSGTLFNIDRSYTLMQGNSTSSVGAITKAKIVDYSMAAVNKGCMSDLVLLVGTATWSDLQAEDMAARMFDSSYSSEKSESGTKEIIYTSINGQIKVICHPMVRSGHAIGFNPDEVIWCGSSKTTFEIPGVSGVTEDPKFFNYVNGTNYVELNNYTDCAIYCLCPARTFVLQGITH
jgi:ribose 5-phosphate isomerase RpiB